MLAIPFLVFLVFAILFPRFTRFFVTIIAFGAMFVVASCIDHAKAAQPSEAMMTNVSAVSTCAKSNASLHAGQLHQVKMLGGDESTMLLMACETFTNSYVYHCTDAGFPEESCYGDLKLIAKDALAGIGD